MLTRDMSLRDMRIPFEWVDERDRAEPLRMTKAQIQAQQSQLIACLGGRVTVRGRDGTAEDGRQADR